MIVILLGFAGSIVYLLAEVYFENPTEFARPNSKLVTDIPFPSVVICPLEPVSNIYIKKFMNNRNVITNVFFYSNT